MTQHDEQRLEQAFDAWTIGESVEESLLLELKMHPIWSQRMLTHESMMAFSSEQNVEVPNWNRDAAFEQYLAKPSWWRQQGLSAAALCFSLVACAIMLFDVKMVTTEQGMQLTFSNQQQTDLMNQQFLELARLNNQVIDQKLSNFEQEQKDNTAQMVNYIMENSRDERGEEIADVVRMWQQQRNTDMQFLRDQFNDINYNIRLANQRTKQRLSLTSDEETETVAEE